ncbi:D-isomer specific 2-hydroxyacid dehydrogenase [Coniella lustricola]|uniref:D-isomer specific 2-hydroxyacid dehydrogenase n=1 Tax=Coniella lustricola TaxID=2025994 RepID=A0A2T3A7N4_9PEZI|nr:D-isomer specific 2-hydroxyacid dehydrogenase [Coniella lustricola]
MASNPPQQPPAPSEPTLHPKALPTATHEVIVVLETIHVPWDPAHFPDDNSLLSDSGKTHEALVYRNTRAGVDDVAARIREASVVVGTVCPLTAEILKGATYLNCIITHAVGTDHIDLEYCRKHNIQVMHTKNCNTETVAEHALALYFATRRSIIKLHTSLTVPSPSFSSSTSNTTHTTAPPPNEWKIKGSLGAHMRDATNAPPRTCAQEVAGIIGYGAVGKEIHRLCAALGMKVLVSERPSRANATAQPARVPFLTLLQQSTILFLALPRTPSTTNLLSHAQLSSLVSPQTILINVSRGGIVDEPAVLDALVHRRLFGYATDVFAVEPAGGVGESCLLGEHYYDDEHSKDRINLVLTPHVAWFSQTTIENSVRMLGENLRAYARGDEEWDNVVVPRTQS